MIRKIPVILVVEDDTENRNAMVKILKDAGYDVAERDNGQDALDYVTANDVDILLTDLQLPVVDGIELLKRVKGKSPDIEVILITGHGNIEVAVEAMKEGA